MSEDKECREEFEVWARDNGYVVTRALDGEWYSQQGTDRAWDVWQACWSRAAKPAVPEGWKPVPLEPTREMIDAAQECDTEGEDDPLSAWGMIYHALVDAAPPLPVAQGWISVKDRLPDTSQHVLLAIGQNVCIGFRSKCDEGLWVSEYGHHLKAPTYWMPRPAAPTPPAAPKEPT